MSTFSGSSKSLVLYGMFVEFSGIREPAALEVRVDILSLCWHEFEVEHDLCGRTTFSVSRHYS